MNFETAQRLAQAKLHKMPAAAREAYNEAQRRLSQTITNAERPESVGYTQESAATVLSAAIAGYKVIAPAADTKLKAGSGDGRLTEFDRAVDTVADAIKAHRERKLETLAANKETNTEKPEAAKSLAELLVEAQDSE